MTFAILLAAAVAGHASAAEMPEKAWPTTMSTHFVLHHQSLHLPPGFLLDIERLHREISRELWFIADGMQTEKIDFYLYPDHEAYIRGSFHPPSWSGGRSEVRRYPNPEKLFLTYDGAPREYIKHELTHLFFHMFWKSADGSPPPLWLDEGLAVTMQGEHLRVERPIPFREFLNSAPQNDDPKARVSDWYAQAGSVTDFLRKARPAFHFKDLLVSLRDGEPLVDALRHSYGFHEIADFEKAWKSWAAVSLERSAR